MSLCHVILTISLFVFSSSQQIGGSGFGLRWDRRRPADIVSWVWDTVPQVDGVSYEMWVKVLDPYIDYQTPFSFGVFDANNGTIYSIPYEISLYVSSGFVSMWKRDKEAACPNATTPYNIWTHVAWTQDYTTGDVIIYQNGELKCVFPEFSRTPPRNHGFVSMGMESSSLDSFSYVDNSLFDGVMDEFRIWNGVRNETEIRNTYLHTLDVSTLENAQKLNVYLNFDDVDISKGPRVLDQTKSIVAEFGRLATYRQYIVQVNKPAGLPSAPVLVQSDCPVFGGLTVILVNETELAFHLPYFSSSSSSNVSALVSFDYLNGTLRQTDDSLISPPFALVNHSQFSLKYLPSLLSSSSQQRAPLEIIDEITYTFFFDNNNNITHNFTGRIQFAWGIEPPVIAESLTTKENTLSFLLLGINSIRGTRLPIEIVNLTQGSLYELDFDPAIVYSDYFHFPNYQSAQMNTSLLTPITSFPYVVNNGPSVILYHPSLDYFGKEIAFHYHVVGDSNIVGFVVTVLHVNQPPLAVNNNIVNTTTTSPSLYDLTQPFINFTFSAVDIDTNYAPRPLYRIIEFPKFGVLYDEAADQERQNSSSGKNNVRVQTQDQSQVFRWAEDIAAVSYVLNNCVDENTTNFRECANTDYSPLEALGPYDFFPKYGDTQIGWSPQFSGEEHWIILQFTPLIVNLIEVFETLNPGAIIRVRASGHFTTVNDSLTWPVLWSSENLLAASLPSQPFVFTPPVCQSFFQTSFIRFDISAREGLGYVMDAVRVTGTTSVDKGWLQGDSAIYVPAVGIHLNSTDVPLDTFSLRASDCESVSDVLPISIHNAVHSKTNHNITYAKNSFAQFTIALSAVSNYAVLKFDELIVLAKNDLLARNVVVSGKPLVELISVDHPILFFIKEGVSAAFSDSISLPFLLSNQSIPVKFRQQSGYFYPVELSVWIYHDLYVHRMAVLLTPNCSNVPGLYQEAAGTLCRVCSSVTVDEYSTRFTTFERVNYDMLCPRLIDDRVTVATADGFAFLTTISLVLAAVVIAWSIWHRDSRIVFSAGLQFLIVTAVGFSLTILGSQLALSDHCFSPWLIHPGLVVALSCGLARNYRLDKIFNLKVLRVPQIDAWQLGLFVFAVFLLDIIILAISTGVKPVQRGSFGECLYSSTQEPLLVAVELALVLLGLFYTYRVRHVPSRYSESKWLNFVYINALVLWILEICLEAAFTLQYGTGLIFRFVIYTWISVIGLCGTFLPKIVAHRKNPVYRPEVNAPRAKINSSISFRQKNSGENDLDIVATSREASTEIDSMNQQLKTNFEEIQRAIKARAQHGDKGKELEKWQMEAETARFILETEIAFLQKKRPS